MGFLDSSSVPAPLDSYSSNLAGAYSVSRRLLSNYSGSLIRVRRSGDNSEYDFGFTSNGNLDTASITAFVIAGGGTQHGHIVTKYDQSGNSRNLTLSTAANQLRIVSSGVLETIGTNTRPCGTASSNSMGPYSTSSFTDYTGTTVSSTLVGHQADTGLDSERFLGLTKDTASDFANAGSVILSFRNTGLNFYSFRSGAGLLNLTTAAGYGAFTRTTRFSGTQTESVLNGVSSGLTSNSTAFDVNRILTCGISSSTGNFNTGNKWSEAVIWFSDIGSTDLETIRTEQATYFGI